MGCKPPVSLWRCGAEPGAIPALAFLRERFSFRAVYVERGIDIRAIYVILNANIPPENVVAALDSFQQRCHISPRYPTRGVDVMTITSFIADN